jgi:hypothetical protein
VLLLLLPRHCCCLRRSRLSPSSPPQVRCAANCCRCAGGYDVLLLLLHCRLNVGARACLFANLLLRFTAA